MAIGWQVHLQHLEFYTQWKCKPKDSEDNIAKEQNWRPKGGLFYFVQFFIFPLIISFLLYAFY